MSTSQLKRYKKIKYLGKGSHGAAILVEAKDSASTSGKEEQRLLVMKEIIIGHLSEQEQKATKMEAELLRQMSHPNIVTCIESFVESSKLYIIMEYADGGDIGAAVQKMISTNTKFTEQQILHIFSQITFAMKYVHDSNILHRDLKSQNIFLMIDGTVKLGDFGIAKVLDKTDDQAQTQIGTPYYLSPELCESSPYGRPSDIWALGIVLYEMMTLELPFQAKSIPALIHKICSFEPSYAKVENVYSPELVGLVKNILQKDPAKRPTIKEIARSDILKDFGSTVLKGSIFKKVPIPSSSGAKDNDISNSNPSSCSPRHINLTELGSALPQQNGFNDIKSPKEKVSSSNNNNDDNAFERNEKLEKLKQFRLQIGRNNKVSDNSESAFANKNFIHKGENSNAEDLVSNNIYISKKKSNNNNNNNIVVIPPPRIRSGGNAASPQLRPKSLAEVQLERGNNNQNSPHRGYSNDMKHIYPSDQVAARSPSIMLYPQGNDYESVIKRNFFANRATALAVKAKVEAMERGECLSGDFSVQSNRVVTTSNKNITHSHRHASSRNDDDYYSAESRITAIKAHKERERVRQLEEKERQLQREHEINRSSRRQMKDVKGIAFEINLSK